MSRPAPDQLQTSSRPAPGESIVSDVLGSDTQEPLKVFIVESVYILHDVPEAFADLEEVFTVAAPPVSAKFHKFHT